MVPSSVGYPLPPSMVDAMANMPAEENAVNLVYAFVGLQDNFNIEGFNEKRQAALIALVACCPRKSAP